MIPMRDGVKLVRKTAGPDVFLLGCCVSQNMRSFGGSFGLVDAIRIGPDNGTDWGGLRVGPWHASNRYFLHGRVWYNDPDPLLWGAYYLAIGLFAILCSFGLRLRFGFISLVMASLLLLGSTWHGVQQYLVNKDGQTLANAMSKEYPYIEQTREFGGATLGLLAAVICFTAARRIPRTNRTSTESTSGTTGRSRSSRRRWTGSASIHSPRPTRS